MDTKELLQQVVDGLINEDEAVANKAFRQYSTLKVRGLLEGDTVKGMKKMKKKEKAACDDDDAVTKDVMDKEKKDD
jgi:hypothetical protein